MKPPDWDSYQAALARWHVLPEETRAAAEAAARAAAQEDQAAAAALSSLLQRERSAADAVRTRRAAAETAAQAVGLVPRARKVLPPSMTGPPTALQPAAAELADAVNRGLAAWRVARALEMKVGCVLAAGAGLALLVAALLLAANA